MTDLRKAAEMALLTLEGWSNHNEWVWPESALDQAKRNTKEAIEALRQALAQPEQEPVAYACKNDVILAKRWTSDEPPSGWVSLFTTAPPKQWVGLTVDEILDCYKDNLDRTMFVYIVQTIEAKLKEKNT